MQNQRYPSEISHARRPEGSFPLTTLLGPTPRRTKTKTQCPLCQKGHFVGYCPTFLRKDALQRQDSISALRLCVNCLRSGHAPVDFFSKHRCSYCSGPHHSLLHHEAVTTPLRTPTQKPNQIENSAVSHSTLIPDGAQAHATSMGVTTVLGTARVLLQSYSGEPNQFRALIDPASESSFVTERVVQLLFWKKNPAH